MELNTHQRAARIAITTQADQWEQHCPELAQWARSAAEYDQAIQAKWEDYHHRTGAENVSMGGNGQPGRLNGPTQLEGRPGEWPSYCDARTTTSSPFMPVAAAPPVAPTPASFAFAPQQAGKRGADEAELTPDSVKRLKPWPAGSSMDARMGPFGFGSFAG